MLSNFHNLKIDTKIVHLLQKMAEIWLFEVLGVPGGPKISNPRKTQNIGPRAKIFGILEYLPKGYLCTKNEQNLFFEGFKFVHFEMESLVLMQSQVLMQ